MPTYGDSSARAQRGRAAPRAAAPPNLDGLAALADPTRRAIFERLADRPQAVGELARELPVSRPAVSQHLKVLKQAGLVFDRRAGNRSIYQVDPGGLGPLNAYLEQFWKRALTAFKAAAEQGTQGEKPRHDGPTQRAEELT